MHSIYAFRFFFLINDLENISSFLSHLQTVVDNASLEKLSSPIHNGNDVCTMYDESKSREVSPKLVVRGKKYGRRSRPQSVAPFESSQSDSEEDYDFARVPTTDDKSAKNYHKVKISSIFHF